MAYRRYGGRGITVCLRWRNSFAAFFADMGYRPSDEHSIDRKDNDKGYWCGKPECPECGPLGREPNCRWATEKEQHRNTSYNRVFNHGGETLALVDWAERLGVPSETIVGRLDRGWSVAEALTTPANELRPSAAEKVCERCGGPLACSKTWEAAQRRFCTRACRNVYYNPIRNARRVPKGRKRACDAAVKVLRETENEAVMWGDETLLHRIAAEMGWECNAWKTSERVLNALSKHPGALVPGKTRTGRGRVVRIFRLPKGA